MKILLVYPQSPDMFWSFNHLLRFVSRRAAFPPPGLLTIAAMLPRNWQLKLVDLNRRLFWSTLLRRPRLIPHANELAIVGYHFRRLGSLL